MATIHLSHVIDCDEDTFWKVFVDNEFNLRLYLDALGFPEFAIVEQNETDTEITRKAKGRPKMNMPGPVVKLLGSSFGYVEEGRLDKKAKTWTFKITPSTLADKMKNSGVVRTEPASEGKIRRIVDITVEAKVFGLGGMLESSAEKSMRDGWETSAKFINEWLAKHPA